MLSRSFLTFSTLKSCSRYYTLSRTTKKQANYKSTASMADSRSVDDFIDMAEELDLTDRGGKRAARGGRSRAGGAGGGVARGNRAGGSGRGEMNREVAISKALSKLLRHAAVDVGLKLDAEGYARVDQVVSISLLVDLSLCNSVQTHHDLKVNIVITCNTRATHVCTIYFMLRCRI
jgi:RNA 2'-phosphotransferase, Tpt1 / KptA family